MGVAGSLIKAKCRSGMFGDKNVSWTLSQWFVNSVHWFWVIERGEVKTEHIQGDEGGDTWRDGWINRISNTCHHMPQTLKFSSWIMLNHFTHLSRLFVQWVWDAACNTYINSGFHSLHVTHLYLSLHISIYISIYTSLYTHLYTSVHYKMEICRQPLKVCSSGISMRQPASRALSFNIVKPAQNGRGCLVALISVSRCFLASREKQ